MCKAQVIMLSISGCRNDMGHLIMSLGLHPGKGIVSLYKKLSSHLKNLFYKEPKKQKVCLLQNLLDNKLGYSSGLV